MQRFSYDADGKVIGVNYNGTYYYCLRNAQGDIVKLIDKNGNAAVEYTYDTWGKLLSTSGSLAYTLGKNNPFRYRGYIYDEETGFYYLQSRYYDPEVRRFISADVYLSTGQGVLGHNAYAYCLNNPVNMSDASGFAAYPRNIFGDPMVEGGGGGGVLALPLPGNSAEAIIDAVIAILLGVIAEVKTEAKTDTIVTEKTLPKADYYGAMIENGSLILITVSMDINEAIVWANITAKLQKIILNGKLDKLGKKRNWGIYTHSYIDAYEIASLLGGGIPVGPELSPQTGCFWHHHIQGRTFYDRYEHFHIWYG